MTSSQTKKKDLVPPVLISFASAGLGGCMAWVVIHPVNTVAIRMNLATMAAGANGPPLSMPSYVANMVKTQGVMSLYSGLGAGLLRQCFYATSRVGFFELLRDEMAKYRPTDFLSRLVVGVVSGGMAAVISCPAEVTLVRMSNDATMEPAKRRNYTGVGNAFSRILREEGVKTFFTGSGPFVNRAMLVGAVQVGTYDEFRGLYRTKCGVTDPLANTFCAAMTSGIIYSVITMPLETTKNRMAFQKPDPATGILPYRGTLQTIGEIVRREGLLKLWAGFPPYYMRCGGHTVGMFICVEWLRGIYNKINI